VLGLYSADLGTIWATAAAFRIQKWLVQTTLGALGEAATIDVADFERVDMRVGRVVEAEPFPEARKPAYKLRIDFGPLGLRRSSAQLTTHYRPEQLVGKLVVAVTNFLPRQIGPVRSEVLVLGVPDGEGAVVLLEPTHDVPLGGRVF
jgi:tRNA-binding protein